MAECGVDRGENSVLRDLVLVVESVPDEDPNEVDRSVRQLRTELKDLDVESVSPVASKEAPPGAKGFDRLGSRPPGARKKCDRRLKPPFRVTAVHADKSTANPPHQPCTRSALLRRSQCILSALPGFRGYF